MNWRSGDVLILEADGGRPDFWLAVEVRADPQNGEPRTVRLVPADIDPICGGSDVPVAEAGGLGALTVRCAFALWLPSKAIRAVTRAGFLAETHLRTVRWRLAELDVGEEPGTALDRETEAELEYRDLAAELSAARRRLLDDAGIGVRASVGVPDTAGPRSFRRVTRPLALAVSLLLTLGLGFYAGRVWDGRRSEPEALGVEGGVPKPLTELPFAWLTPRRSSRTPSSGDMQVLSLNPEVPYGALFLDVGVAASDTDYQLVIRRRGAAEILWSGPARRTGVAEVFVLLPTADLESGNYRFELYGAGTGATDGGAARFVYELRLERRATPDR